MSGFRLRRCGSGGIAVLWAVPAAVLLVALCSLIVWLCTPQPSPAARIPVADGPGFPVPEAAANANSGLIKGPGVRSNAPGSWPRFRGKDSSGICNESTPLAKSWLVSGPPVLWSVSLGDGYAGAAIHNGAVYVLDYDKQQKADVLRCLSFNDGQEIWRYSYPVKVKPNHGMSRTIPAVTDKYVVILGPLCHVHCLDSNSGELVWSKDLVKQFGATVPEWYAGQCPLIDGDRVILAPAAEALLIAVDLKSGDVIWKSANPQHWTMTHSSIMPMQLNGTQTYVYCGSGGMAGVSAADGKLLWESNAWTIRQATIASPLPIDGSRIFFSGGYSSGALMLEVRSAGDQFAGSELFRLKPQVFGSYQHTPILYNGCIYGVRPDGQLVCLDLEGKIVWTSGTERFSREGSGPYTLGDGLLYVMDDSGTLTLVEATPAAYKRLAQAKVLSGSESWGPMALAGGRLIARDINRMVCLDVSEHK